MAVSFFNYSLKNSPQRIPTKSKDFTPKPGVGLTLRSRQQLRPRNLESLASARMPRCEESAEKEEEEEDVLVEASFA